MRRKGRSMSKGLLVVVSGPSGAGKGTICKELLDRNPNINLSVSTTTRKPRNGELEGINYFFKERNTFEDMIDDDEFLEHAEVYGNYYGTPRSYAMDKINKGEDILLEIDIQGALQVKEKYPDGVFIFILPPSLKELKNRIIGRGSETEESLITRYGAAKAEMEFAFKYDYGVVNDTVEKATEKVEAILLAEKSRISRIKDIIKNIEEE